MDLFETLATAELRCLNAARSGCPLAQFAAHNARARALNAALAEQANLDYAADPEGFTQQLEHDRAMSADAYYYPAA